jgi:hypothetical protein
MTDTAVAPFRIRHQDGREYDLEGDQAVALFQDHYRPQGFVVVADQPFYGHVPDELSQPDELPKWFRDRQAKSDDALPLPLKGEKAGEYDERVAAEKAALEAANQQNAEASGDQRDVSPPGDVDQSETGDVEGES